MTSNDPADASAVTPPSGVDGVSRPAVPLYGEYATPEQQRAAIRQPAAAGVSVPSADHGSPTLTGPRREPVRPMHATTSAARPSRTADRVITIILLTYGLFTVLGAVPQLWYFTRFAQSWMDLAGVDADFTNVAQGELWGRIGAAVFILGWALTAGFSWRSLRHARLGWWIPLVGAIITFVIATICLTIPLFGDPAIASHFRL